MVSLKNLRHALPLFINSSLSHKPKAPDATSLPVCQQKNSSAEHSWRLFQDPSAKLGLKKRLFFFQGKALKPETFTKKTFEVQDLRSAHIARPTFSTTSLYSGCCHVTTSQTDTSRRWWLLWHLKKRRKYGTSSRLNSDSLACTN